MSNFISLSAVLAMLLLAALTACTPATAAPSTESAATGTPKATPSPSTVTTLEPPPTFAPSPTPPPATPTLGPALTVTPAPTSTPDLIAEAIRLYDESQVLFDAGDLDAALALINQSLSYNPDSADALRARSTLWLWVEGDVEAAVADLEAAIGLEPEHPDSYLLLAGTYHSANRNDEARAALDAALELGASDGDYYNLRALIRSKDDDDRAGAESDARTAVTASGGSRAAIDTLAFVLLRSGKPEESLELYDILEQGPGDFYYSRLGKGLALWQLGQTDVATPILKSGLELLKTEPNYRPLITWEPQTVTLAFGAVTRIGDPAIEESLDLINSGELEGAAAYLEEMRQWAIGDYLFFANSTSGELYAELGRHEEAIVSYTHAIGYNPTGFLHYSRARSYYQLGLLADALNDVERRHELSVPNVNSLRLSSVIRRDLGDYEGALADIEAAVVIDPADLYLRTRLADRLVYLRRYDHALQELNEAEALVVTDADVYAVAELRAIVYMGLRRFEDAIAEADAVESLSSDPWSAHIIRAIAYEELGDSAQSLSFFEAAEALNAGDQVLNWYRDLANLRDS